MLKGHLAFLFGCLTTAGTVLAGPALTAADADSGGENTQRTDQLEEIVVSAQRRSENIQNVPISVDSLGEAALKDAEVTNVMEIPTLVSGLRFSDGGGVATVFMRGIGNPAQTIGNESSVAIYIDDVYYARLPSGALELNNIQSVETLKGPQGTLFGRNADAGVIQIFTRNPGQTPTAHIDVGYGNYNTAIANLYASSGFGDKVTGDIAVHVRNQQDGWGHFEFGGEPYGYLDDESVRSKWIIEPTDATKITFIADYFNDKTTEGLVAKGMGGTPELAPPYTLPLVANPTIGFYDAQNGSGHGESFGLAKDKSAGATLKIEQEFNAAILTSISAYRRGSGLYATPADFSIAGVFEYTGPYSTRELTQELRLASLQHSSFDWQVGAFFMDLTSSYRNACECGEFISSALELAGLPPGSVINFSDSVNVKSYAVYTQETFHLTSSDDLTAGVRYTEDKDVYEGVEAFDNPALGLTGPFPGYPNSTHVSFPKITYRAAFDHRFNADLLGYVSYSRGYKSGTFNLLPPTATPAKPEELDAIEIGAKTSFFDQRLRLNPAVFFNHVENPQVQQDVGFSIQLVNGGAAKSYGIDLDGEALLTDRLHATFSAEWLRATYTSYVGAPTASAALPYGLTAYSAFNAAGKDLPDAPHAAFDIGLNYTQPTPVGSVKLSSQYAYTARFVFDPDQVAHQGSYGLLTAAATYVAPGAQHWSLAIWGKNLAGKEYIVTETEFQGPVGALGGLPGGHGTAPGAPRTYGLTAAYDF